MWACYGPAGGGIIDQFICRSVLLFLYGQPAQPKHPRLRNGLLDQSAVQVVPAAALVQDDGVGGDHVRHAGEDAIHAGVQLHPYPDRAALRLIQQQRPEADLVS